MCVCFFKQTLDGLEHHFQGIGVFDYLRSCDDSSSFPLTISAKQTACGPEPGFSCIRAVYVSTTDDNGDAVLLTFPNYGFRMFCMRI